MSAKVHFCEICKEPSDPERIEAIPETRLCTEHAGQIQKYGGEFVVTAIQTALGKEGSLKKNYGDVSTSKTRNQIALDRLRDEFELQQFANQT